jgi:hypothetical protein
MNMRRKAMIEKFKVESTQETLIRYLRDSMSSKLFIAILSVLLVGILLLGLGSIPKPKLLIQQLGGVLVVSATTAMIYEYFLRRNFLSLLKAQMKLVVEAVLPVVNQLSSLGIEHVYENRTGINWADLFMRARTIKILGTSLSYWAHDPNIKKAFSNALNKGCEIQLLSLEPKSEYARERGRDINVYERDPENSFSSEISSSVEELRKLSQKIDFRYYDAMPTCVIVIIDDRIIVNFVLRGLRGRDSMHFMLRRTGESAIFFQNHYYAIFKLSKPVK